MEGGDSLEPETTEVLPQHKFDTGSLEAYLNQHLPGFGAEPEAHLTVAQYRSGQSNPTFYLQKGYQAYVLRKKPSGSLLPKAHKIDREFKVQKALFSIGFPVPKPLLYCSDASIIGTEFYMMEHVQGRIFRDFTIPGVSPAERSAIYVAMIETLARLHSLNVQSLQLEGYGRGAGYCKRQVSTWIEQYKAAAHQDILAMNQLFHWLMKNLPDNDNEENLIHGDYKLDNIVFHPTESRVIAVLDWELSTIGHPLSDLAHLSVFYFWPRTVPMINQSSYFQENIGIPSMEEMISIYCRCRGINSILPNWNFFIALTYFKMASIAQGVYRRYLQGNNASENSFLFAKIVQPLAETGLQLSKRTFGTTPPQIDTSQQFFVQSKTGQAVLIRMKHFMKQHILPAEKEVIEFYVQNENSVDRWKKPLVIDKLKEMAKAEGLWNLFLPAVSGLSQVDYALIAEETGKCFFAPDVFNCQAPDTGNMEVLHLYGSEKQKQQWLEPLLQGNITSCFCMTEPDVASSDATNIECSIEQDGDSYVINGKKWWSSGAGNPKCTIAIVLGRTKNTSAARHKQHTMVLVPINTPGVEIIRPLSIFGYMDYLHGGHFEIHFNQVRVPATNIILGVGRGFEIAQGRLGPGRIHHCMRIVGLAERALQIMCERATKRVAFNKKLFSHEVVAHWIAKSRIAIEKIRLLTLKAAHSIDTVGSTGAKKEIAMIKVAAPRAICKIIDRAIQVCGGAGVSQDYPLATMYALTRALRIADGPDEVHLSAIAALELRDQARDMRSKV
ncbi:LOW QUALITY PROTEIN: acyl-CoA dehydrogenase family member 11 [Prionailurus bengalensis]|uniref:LOW QUALITY PROTEIN: acyl-CoA dehydrogenase family member 11 n=1 Tax=Prionailurus bengalensis TaxID=37029 RepID=UPI001CA8C1E4|nr:LOW QUALITY PROTEIN: acyl-CoA dehydrogenase family member 11 [Prionailurus bengalensis]